MRRTILVMAFVLACTVSVVLAQSEACPTIVETALQSVGDRCATLGRNSACYGSSIVKSTIALQPPSLDFFSEPGDTSQLVYFREINPQPLNQNQGTFGVAVLNAQANVPDTLPGQAVVFLLVGDARLTNEVPAEGSDQSPFQSFYFLPGVNRSGCYQADPMLTIQTPGNTTITISLNGVETEMSPSTLLTITPSVCTIHRGHIVQRVGEDTAVLLANQTVDIHIESNGQVVVENARGISQREYERGLQVQQALNALAAANNWSEQFITAPREFDVEPDETQSPCAVQHTVASGETLRRIAQTYGTTIPAIVAANQLADPNLIFIGQRLCIPAPAGP